MLATGQFDTLNNAWVSEVHWGKTFTGVKHCVRSKVWWAMSGSVRCGL